MPATTATGNGGTDCPHSVGMGRGGYAVYCCSVMVPPERRLAIVSEKGEVNQKRLHHSERYSCIFFLCFSLFFFFTGVLVGVGDGVPEGSGVGDGRTRGWANMP
jgi:hypothetical protein